MWFFSVQDIITVWKQKEDLRTIIKQFLTLLTPLLANMGPSRKVFPGLNLNGFNNRI